jgi:hypothetical protein
MARHLVVVLLRSGGWRVRIIDLGPEAILEPAEKDGLLGAALRDGRAVYVSADICELSELTEGTPAYVLLAAELPQSTSRLHTLPQIRCAPNPAFYTSLTTRLA